MKTMGGFSAWRLAGCCAILQALVWSIGATASEALDDWHGWDALPDNLLEETGAADQSELLLRLEQLRTGDTPAAPEAYQRVPDHVLERWLNHLGGPHGRDLQSLDDFLQDRPGQGGPLDWAPAGGRPGGGPPADRPGGGPPDDRPGGGPPGQ